MDIEENVNADPYEKILQEQEGFAMMEAFGGKLSEPMSGEQIDTEQYVDVYGKPITKEEAVDYYESYTGEASSVAMTGEQINAELDQIVAKSNNLPTSPVLWSFGFEAEDLLAVYAALRTYLRALTGQDDEDLEMIGRIARLLSRIKPSVVKASKSLALKAVGMEDRKL